jgi:phage FluMu protein Com
MGMPIEFHCEHCGKLVRAGDEHAGRQGKCPGCNQSVYIPTPDEQLDVIPLAPVDEQDVQEQEKLLAETRGLVSDIMRDRELPPESASDRPAVTTPQGDARLDRVAMEEMLVQYARHMADGDLARGEELAQEIRRDLPLAEDVIGRMVSDEIPPEGLADIPRPVLVALFRQLREGA